MHIVHVSIHVSADRLVDFKMATVQNARQSLREPGVAPLRFCAGGHRSYKVCAGGGLSDSRGRD